MKFLCRNCKAKYQIADEKVAGRTLRMTCQQCGEPIVVRGPARSTGPIAAPRPVAAPVAQTQTALHGADLAHLAAPAREREQTFAHEEWHVAINDQPVGPLRRDEVARRIAQGEIDRESLAWREGMDDWLAVKHIAELSALFGRTGAGHAGGSGALKMPQVAMAPSARVDMAPIGGRQVVAAEELMAPSEPEPAPVAVAEVAEAAPPPPASEAQGRQPGWAQMFALVSGGAFILAAGALLGVRVLAPSNQPPPAATVAAPPAAAQPAQPAPSAQPQADNGSGSVIELDPQSIDGQQTGGQRKSGGSKSADANAKDSKGRPLTAEQKEMLERMGGGLDQGPSNLRAPTDTGRPAGAQAGQLTAEQLSAVVLNGRKNLQRCYETALRGASSTDTVRLDVDIEVSPNGNVTRVKTAGKGLPGMEECITRTVKMWRFPMSGEATQTHFPVVFQPGA